MLPFIASLWSLQAAAECMVALNKGMAYLLSFKTKHVAIIIIMQFIRKNYRDMKIYTEEHDCTEICKCH